MKVYFYFNGRGLVIPESLTPDKWSKCVECDAAKVAMIAARSWTVQGWKVVRLVSPDNQNVWKGRLAHSDYPFNGFLPALRDAMVQNSEEGAWFTTSDIINQSFQPFKPNVSHWCPYPCFTLSAGYVELCALDTMLDVLYKYDKGDILSNIHPIDETVLRHYQYCPVHNAKSMSFPPDWSKMLVHVSRSAVHHLDEEFVHV